MKEKKIRNYIIKRLGGFTPREHIQQRYAMGRKIKALKAKLRIVGVES